MMKSKANIYCSISIYFLMLLSPTYSLAADNESLVKNEQKITDCLSNIESKEIFSDCLNSIYTKLEGKRLVLENTAKHKSFDPNSTIDWKSFYNETLSKSRYFFEEYRNEECNRKEILSNTGLAPKFGKLICLIRMTKDRINNLQ